MAHTPYVIGLVIQYPSGTALANVNVTVRNEATNEANTQTTNSSGEVNFNLGSSKDYPSGWEIGDIFSWVVLYQGFESSGSHTTAAEGGFSQTIVLTAVPALPSLNIFKPQEFLDYFNMKSIEDDAENGISMQQLVRIGVGVEQSIENETQNKFDSNDGNYYSQTEHIDTDKYEQLYFTTKIPVISVTALYTTQNDEEGTPDYPNNTTGWNTLTEGTDFTIDLNNGRINIQNSSYQPITRHWGLYIDYKYGRATVPEDIKIIAMIETGIRMFDANFARNKIKKISDTEIGDLDSFNEFKRRVFATYRNSGFNTSNT